MKNRLWVDIDVYWKSLNVYKNIRKSMLVELDWFGDGMFFKS